VKRRGRTPRAQLPEEAASARPAADEAEAGVRRPAPWRSVAVLVARSWWPRGRSARTALIDPTGLDLENASERSAFLLPVPASSGPDRISPRLLQILTDAFYGVRLPYAA